MTTVLKALTAHPFLTGLSADHLVPLEFAARIVEFPAGRRIFDEDGNADRFWLLITGKVALDLHTPGKNPIVETLTDGDPLGWSWLFPPCRWHFGAIALDDTRAIELSAGPVRTVCDLDPAFGNALTRRFLAVVTDRLQSTRVRLLDMYAAGRP